MIPAWRVPMSKDSDRFGISRRSLLGGVAGAGMLSVLGSPSIADEEFTTTEPETLLPEGFEPQTPVDSYHPGEPRFVAVGEKLFNPIWAVGFNAEGTPGDGPDNDVLFDKGRDHLGPRLPELGDFEEYDPEDFEWSLVDAPDGSAGEQDVLSFTTDSSDVPRYDGMDGENVAEFQADVEGWYTLELDAPDGTHELTIYAFPETDGAAVYPSNPGTDNGAPRIALDAEYNDEEGQFTIHSNAAPAPQEDSDAEDLWTQFVADDRDGLSTDDIHVDEDDLTATVDVGDIGGDSARIHAAAFDDNVWKKSAADVIELHDDGTIDLPSRPPEWLKDSVMYQIFPRSWGGKREETTLQTLIDGTLRDGSEDARGVDYLDELGVDVLWITPVVPATSVERQFAYLEDFDIVEGMGIDDGEQHLSGGGPHGYDTSDYTGISQDLSPEWDREHALELYEEFIEACHDHGIKVLFDIVINHAGRTHPQFQETIAETEEVDPWPVVNEWDTDSAYFDWWDRADTDLLDEDGDLLETAPRATGFADLQVMPNLNFDNVVLREYMLAVADFWSREVGVDGFRADIAYGVPHDIWKEIREVVRANDSEFLMFDESIPRVAALSENMFSLHHDTAGFLTTTHGVVADDAHGGSLFNDIEQRTEDAIPDHSLFVNTLENHDEHRVLNQAAVDLGDPNHDEIDDESWEFYAQRMRLCWAAAITMPGVPKLYYGQERQISRFGEGRYLGDEDDRGRDNGDINVDADVREGGRQRAFMNWDEYPEDHLAFYKDLNQFYHDHEVLHTDASFEPIFFDVEDDEDAELLLFGRDGSDLDIDGPDRVSVVLNFNEAPETVELAEGTDTYDLFHEEDVAAEENDEDDSVTVVEVDDLVVLETEDFGEEFDVLATWEEAELPPRSEHGPGWYEYPTADDFNDGAFDIVGFEVRDGDENVQFVYEIEDLEDPWDGESGYSLQFPQVYVHDPESEIDGRPDPQRDGIGVEFETDYHVEVMGTGDWGAWVDFADGSDGLEADTFADIDENRIVLEAPKSAFEADIDDLEVAPLLLGFDGDFGVEGVREVIADEDEWQFTDTEFGEEADDTRHNVIDAVTPNELDNEDVLAYDDANPAEVPFVDMGEGIRNRVYPGELVREHDGGDGTGFGPGDYIYPTNLEIPDGSIDIHRVAVYEDPDDEVATVAFEMDPDGLENQFDLPRGFSHPAPQVYIRDPESDAPGTEVARDGVQATLDGEYQYRVVADGDSITEFEDAEGSDVGSLDVDLVEMDAAIALQFSTEPLDAPLEAHELAFAVSAHDGFGPGGLRDVVTEDEEQEWVFAGAKTDNAPRILDTVTPSGVSQEEALSASDDDLATIPYLVQTRDLDDYTENGEVSTENLQEAEADWEDGETDTETLREAADNWRRGDSE